MHQRLVPVAVCCWLLLAPVAAPVAALDATATTAAVGGAGAAVDDPAAASSPSGAPVSSASVASAATADHDIRLTTTLALTPDTPGEVTVTLTFAIPERVTALDTTISPDADPVSLDGFAAADGDTYEWDGDTATPTITYRLPANRTSATARLDRGSAGVDAPRAPPSASAPAAQVDGERYLFADPGPWALVAVPSPGVGWRYRGDVVGLTRTADTAGPGAVGSRVAFLGEHTVRERTAHGQTFRLVVPAAADEMREDPAAVLDALASASETLRVGDRDGSVFLVAAPTDVPWAVRGLQTGDADAWVRADEPLTSPESPWLHEYVHTRQSFATTAETRWVVEGSADYYAALLALRQGLVGFDEFADHLAQGARDPFAEAVLADPDTWVAGAQYRKGGLVAGDLDRRIRLASDGGATLSTVVARLNAEGDAVSGDRFEALVADAGDADVGDAAGRFTRTDAAPDMWSAEAHAAAFDTAVARIRVDAPDDVAVSGEYRNATVTPPATLAVGETVAVPVAVGNAGDAAGTYRLRATVDGRTVATANGTLAPGANATARLSWTPSAAGTYTLSVRGRSYEVTVAEPAAPTVAALSTNRTSVAPGGSVLVVAEVTADGPVPAAGDLTVRVDGRTVATERVRVAPNGSTTLRVPVVLDSPGEYVVAVGDARATVTVAATAAADGAGAADERGTDPEGTAVSTPGFGASDALAGVAVAVVGAAAARRRRSER
ncbi:CARDB domain-containing protein [Halobaculum lipolyticum]|uniref:CARDB domain-containing protein n=1 Tax=Halobaculum lipolyticum TaxID=3032001 RepID=UPI0024C331A9|nr:CARDB domain-containing protein [Halobaculum sp. DT31]